MYTDEYFMNIALKEAKKALKLREVPVGAVIVKNNKIISKAYNLRESKTITTQHAEILAIEKACKKLKNWRLLDCIIYVTMFPCPMCASAINQSRINKIVYGTIPEYANKTIIHEILKDKYYGQPVDIVGPVMKDDCEKLLKDFFIKKR